MNPFLLSPAERLAAWRTFRLSLADKAEMEQLENIATWVAQAPTTTFVLDCDDPKSWPKPWDLLNEGNFDETAKAYLMYMTLVAVGWSPSRLKLSYIRNSSASIQTMILLVDDTWALNYLFSEVMNFDTERVNCAYLVSYQDDPDGGLMVV
jgi:hypothetical protein